MEITTILLSFLKKKRIIADIEKARSETEVADITLKKSVDLFIRDAICGMGTILLEDLDNHYYITSVKIGIMGNVLAYALIQRDDEIAHIVVYAHEGLIPQHLSEKTIAKLKTKLTA